MFRQSFPLFYTVMHIYHSSTSHVNIIFLLRKLSPSFTCTVILIYIIHQFHIPTSFCMFTFHSSSNWHDHTFTTFNYKLHILHSAKNSHYIQQHIHTASNYTITYTQQQQKYVHITFNYELSLYIHPNCTLLFTYMCVYNWISERTFKFQSHA